MELYIQEQENKVIGKLKGRLDTLASTQFALDMKPLMDMAEKQIILDCKELEFISSSGLRLFLTLRKQSMSKGGSIIIANINDNVRDVFSLTGFFSLFTFM